jgi:hypothetical protein
LTGVAIAGPENGVGFEMNVFTATVTPPESTGWVTYTWTPAPEAGQGTPRATYSWDTTGVQTLTVTAATPGGVVVSDTHTIEVELSNQVLYFPMIYHGAWP